MADQLAREQFEQQKTHAADALRMQSSLASARLAQAAAQAAGLAGYRKESLAVRKAADALRESHLSTMESIAQKRLDKLNEPFDPNSKANIPVLDPQGKVIGIKTPLGPNRWQVVPLPKNQPTANPELTSSLRVASAAAALNNLPTSSPFYSVASNALQRANELLPQQQFKTRVMGAMNAGQPLPPNPLLSQPTPVTADILDAPLETQARKVGQSYRTPKGVFKWTEGGWQASQ